MKKLFVFACFCMLALSNAAFANEIIPVPIEPNATYESLSLKKPSATMRQIIVKRMGSSGVTYTEILVNCDTKMFRVLGDGETEAQMRKHKNSDKEFVQLIEGSGKFYQVEYACSK